MMMTMEEFRVGCQSVFGQKAGHVGILALKKQDRPKFKVFSTKIAKH
jgi:hypothetical protein